MNCSMKLDGRRMMVEGGAIWNGTRPARCGHVSRRGSPSSDFRQVPISHNVERSSAVERIELRLRIKRTRQYGSSATAINDISLPPPYDRFEHILILRPPTIHKLASSRVHFALSELVVSRASSGVWTDKGIQGYTGADGERRGRFERRYR